MSQKLPFVRSPYNYDTNKCSDETGLTCPEPTLAQQQFAEESDINFIANRYGLTGEMPIAYDAWNHGDFEGIFDFQSAQDAVIRARDNFMSLPAKMRARFDNDPQKLLSFLADNDNREEAIFLGLVSKPEPAPATPPTAPVAETQPAAPTQAADPKNPPS